MADESTPVVAAPAEAAAVEGSEQHRDNRRRGRGRGRGKGRGRGRGRGRGGRGRGRGRGRNDPEYKETISKTDVFVKDLTDDITEEILVEHFSTVAPVASATIRNRFGRLLGSVKFETDEGAAQGLTMNGTELHGRIITVEPRRIRRRITPAPASGEEGDAAAASADGAASAATTARAVGSEGGAPSRRRGNGRGRDSAAAEGGSVEPNPCRVFVGNLNDVIPTDILRQTFGASGTVEHVERRKNKRFAVLTFASAEAATKAIEANNGKAIEGFPDHTLKVEHEQPELRRRNPNPRRLFVGNLPDGVNEDALKAKFDGVESVKLRENYAFVVFDSDETTTAALAKHATKMFPDAEPVRIERSQR